MNDRLIVGGKFRKSMGSLFGDMGHSYKWVLIRTIEKTLNFTLSDLESHWRN